MIFEWDPKKATSNEQRHNVSFEESMTAFDDEVSVLAIDESRIEGELRLNLIGLTKRGLLFIVFTEPDSETIRIISARKATKFE